MSPRNQGDEQGRAMFDKDRITYLSNGKWKGGGVIPAGLQRIEDLSAWIGSFITYCKQLGKDYTVFAANDGTMIGQEKASLAASLEGLMGALLVFRVYLSQEKKKNFKSLENRKGFSFSVSLEYNSWTGNGYGPLPEDNKRYNFADWYNSVLLKNLGDAIRSFAQAQADGTITADESINLIGLVEQIVADVLDIDRVLVTKDLSQ